MAGRGGAGEPVVGLDDAVKMLMEHLVAPELQRRKTRQEATLVAKKHEAVARQVHAVVLLYNYYYRKQFPHLEFADPNRFSVSTSLAAGKDSRSNGDEGVELSVTDKAVMDACGIAEALDATVDAPEIRTWPISKVAVLLLDPSRKRCLIENGTVTNFIWSILEKDITTASENSPSSEMLSSKAVSSEPYMLQQTAYSLVESKTGMKRTSLSFLEEHLVYSLSRKETTAKLFVVQYEQNVNGKLKRVNAKLKEKPLEDLIRRMSGPIFRSDPQPSTTSVVELYHLLPYKDIMLNLHNRLRKLPKDRTLRQIRKLPKDRTLRPKKAPEVDPIVKNRTSENQIVEVKDISGCITDNKNDQMYASLRALQKMRDDTLREHCMVGDRSAQLDMDIQTILTEGRMTPRVMSILRKYENKSYTEMKVASTTNSGERYQTMNMKRRRLTEAIILRDKCQELDAICRENNWILPRYTVLPSTIDGLYQASVHLICPDLEMSANCSDIKTTPHEARESAATNMLYQLQKAKEKLVDQGSSTPDAALHDKTTEK